MLAIDEDLRHGRAAVGALDHLVAPPRLLHQVGLGERHPLAFEQRPGMRAIGAPHRAVHLDLGHRAASPENALQSLHRLTYGAIPVARKAQSWRGRASIKAAESETQPNSSWIARIEAS